MSFAVMIFGVIINMMHIYIAFAELPQTIIFYYFVQPYFQAITCSKYLVKGSFENSGIQINTQIVACDKPASGYQPDNLIAKLIK